MTAPLAGLRVIELAEGVAGPYLGAQLAMAGADVVKVETPTGDCAREWVPLLADGMSGPFVALNQGKRSVCLDAADPRLDAVAGHLRATADVVILDDTSEALALFGGAAGVSAANPRAICCTISGYGPAGPAAGEAAGELPAQMMSGASASLGRIGDPPVRMTGEFASVVAAVYSMQAVVAALLERETSGIGQAIDVSLTGGMIAMRSTLWVAHSDPEEWWGFHLDNAVKQPFRGYETASGRAYIAVPGAAFEKGLAEELGIEGLHDDARYSLVRSEGISPGSRHTDELHGLWESAFTRHTTDELRTIIGRHGGQVLPANDYEQLTGSPVAEAINLVREFDQPGIGPMRGVAAPWDFNGEGPLPIGGAPRLGEHNNEVLSGLHGISPSGSV